MEIERGRRRQGRKGKMKGWKEERKEGREEGREGGRKEGGGKVKSAEAIPNLPNTPLKKNKH